MREFDILDGEFSVAFKNGCLQALTTASDVYLSKVRSGRKVSRTDEVKKAFGKFYSPDAEEFSAIIDRFTGVCDDLNDDDRMEKSERELMMGLLARTVWEIIDLFPRDTLQEVSGHLKKMLYIQIAERITMEKMMLEENGTVKIQHGVLNYKIRSVDIDIFAILPSRVSGLSEEQIINAARLYRMVDLYAKDMSDREYDIRNHTTTPVTVLYQKGIDPAVLREPLWEYVKYNFDDIFRQILRAREQYVAENFYEMAKERYRTIQKNRMSLRRE